MLAMTTMALAVQAAQVAGPPLPAELRPVRTPDPAAAPCGTAADDDGEIVVCARSRDADRLKPVDDTAYARRPVRAATTIGGRLGVAAEAELGTLPNGQSSPRAMVRLRLPF